MEKNKSLEWKPGMKTQAV